MRAVMEALIDQDGGHLERWRPMVGAETAIVWDAHLGGTPVCLIGIESRNVTREGYRPFDGPSSWNAGTLFPLSSKKVARAINAASGNRPLVVLANLSGFDGSPESMRKLQLEYGAEIARAVVNFEGPISFLVVSRYHGGAYVVFSQALNPNLRASALEGSFASVIGGGPAAAVVFGREVRARALADPRVVELERAPARAARARRRASASSACSRRSRSRSRRSSPPSSTRSTPSSAPAAWARSRRSSRRRRCARSWRARSAPARAAERSLEVLDASLRRACGSPGGVEPPLDVDGPHRSGHDGPGRSIPMLRRLLLLLPCSSASPARRARARC